MNWAPRSPRVLSALALSLAPVPALLGAAPAATATDPTPEGPSHAHVQPAEVECDRGAGTVTVVGQVFPVLSRSAEGRSELSLDLAAELAGDAEAAENAGTAGGAEAVADLELALAPHAQPLPGVTPEEMTEAADRAGPLTATLSGTGGRLLSGDGSPTLAWQDWEPPVGFYEVRVATGTFSLTGFGDCAVVGGGPLASVQVGTEEEQEQQREAGADEASGPSDRRDHLPRVALAVGVLGALCLLVPAVLHLRGRAAR
ncbi:hypothetical protein GCM10007079_12160 [Nocardiopsis terrae]|uniref:Uncharacterized protein n=1 Tax=Nocardiopsis terrae TaxID=372655 RepID=A0ABR9HC15_9ACTN|nr:hypothetical protein [Nocardiopsis terrae]MBE1456574.1 hypothetical protein [Nocardiopsis terrae]GHC76127.1 hypothetical protein GCM10007079_12160 [Nocardiopsis terrae]